MITEHVARQVVLQNSNITQSLLFQTGVDTGKVMWSDIAKEYYPEKYKEALIAELETLLRIISAEAL